MQVTSDTLRDTLFNEIYNLIEGKSTPERANAVSKLANSALKSVEIELDYLKYKDPNCASDIKLGTMRLSNNKDE